MQLFKGNKCRHLSVFTSVVVLKVVFIIIQGGINMKLRNILGSALIISLASFALQGCNSAKAPAPKEKLVVQISEADPAKWNLALNNVKNVQQAYGADKVEVEVVVYGPGIGMLKADSVIANRVEEAKKSGVSIVACENTMKANKLTKEDMLPNTSYVQAGVVEIMKKQQEGYAYIRP